MLYLQIEQQKIFFMSLKTDKIANDRIERDRQRAIKFDSRDSKSAARMLPKVKQAHRAAAKNPFAKMPGLSRKIAVSRPRIAPHSASRRAFVRIRFTANKSKGQWAAHGMYLEREGAQKEGERGEGFDKNGEKICMSEMCRNWQEAGDDKIFKMTLSPEDGDRLDLEKYTKNVMARIEEQAGQPLEWIAIQHSNTEHPHVHILIRGQGVVLDRELINKNARGIAQDEATKELGYRSQREINSARKREIEQRRFTSLDNDIKKHAVKIPENDKHAPGFFIEPRVPSTLNSTAQQRTDYFQQIGRLNALCEIGVAEKVGHKTYKLYEGWEKALRELEVLQTRSSMLVKHRELMTDPRCQPVVTKLKEGEMLTGRVLGTGLDEKTDNSYLLIEGSDGKAHFIYQNKKIEQMRGEHQLQPGALVSIESKPIKDAPGKTYLDVKDYGVEVPAKGFSKVEIPAEILDNDLKNREKTGKNLPDSPATVGFAGAYQRALVARAPEFERIKSEKEQAKIERDAAYQAKKAQWEKEKAEREQRKAERDALYNANAEKWAREKAERDAKRNKNKDSEIE